MDKRTREYAHQVLIAAVILTAQLGKITFNNHIETWYDLNMSKICQRAYESGIQSEYSVNDNGVKMYGNYVIVAADWNIHPYGSLVETSHGTGIVLDTHTAKDRALIDIATTWKRGAR